METCFDNANFSTPPTILGRRMRGFTLGHARLLWSVRSPLIAAVEDVPTLEDYLTAALLCSFPWRVSRWLLLHPTLLAFISRRWGARVKAADIAGGGTDLQAYISQSCAFPDRWKDIKEQPHDPGIPWPWMIAWPLFQSVGDRCWDMLMPEAMSYYCCESARNGARFVTESQRESAGQVGVKPREGAANG